MDYIITTEQLTKKYKNFTSVNNVSIHIRKGSIYGFLGPNGAGKSTTKKMLLGLTAQTKGSLTIDGKQFPGDRIAILKVIGSFIEVPAFFANLAGGDDVVVIRRILGLPKAEVEDALELVGITEFGDRLAKKYSLGMKQRLGLAGALVQELHFGQQCFTSYSQGQHLWFSRPQRCGKIHDHENAAGPDCTDKGQLYH